MKSAVEECYGVGSVSLVSMAFRWLNHHSAMSQDFGDEGGREEERRRKEEEEGGKRRRRKGGGGGGRVGGGMKIVQFKAFMFTKLLKNYHMSSVGL